VSELFERLRRLRREAPRSEDAAGTRAAAPGLPLDLLAERARRLAPGGSGGETACASEPVRSRTLSKSLNAETRASALSGSIALRASGRE
jgi:hypothetical protein